MKKYIGLLVGMYIEQKINVKKLCIISSHLLGYSLRKFKTLRNLIILAVSFHKNML